MEGTEHFLGMSLPAFLYEINYEIIQFVALFM